MIGPFNYDPMEYVGNYIQLPDALLLKVKLNCVKLRLKNKLFFFFSYLKKYFSTSPEQEPRDFIDSLKNTFKAMIEYPNPLATYFKQNAPNVYRKEENGKWIREMS